MARQDAEEKPGTAQGNEIFQPKADRRRNRAKALETKGRAAVGTIYNTQISSTSRLDKCLENAISQRLMHIAPRDLGARNMQRQKDASAESQGSYSYRGRLIFLKDLYISAWTSSDFDGSVLLPLIASSIENETPCSTTLQLLQ